MHSNQDFFMYKLVGILSGIISITCQHFESIS